jgi:aldehyde:ferredoxin oxidoreductase
MLLTETDAKARVACIGPAGDQKVLFAGLSKESVIIKAARVELPPCSE